MSYETLRCDVEAGLALITLNRPESLNAINLEMMRDLHDVAIRVDEDPEVRAVLLAGAGKAFCAGGDLASFAEMGDRFASFVKEGTTYLHAAISRLARAKAPVVAAVHGSAAGAGLSLAASADLVLAADTARFTLAYTRIGLSPDGSATFFLPRLIGLRRTQELLFTNRILSAAEALDWGLVTRVVPEASLAEEARKLATSLAAGPTTAYGSGKRLLLASTGDRLETQMEAETRSLSDVGRSSDAPEGIRAFLEKRPARFTGR